MKQLLIVIPFLLAATCKEPKGGPLIKAHVDTVVVKHQPSPCDTVYIQDTVSALKLVSLQRERDSLLIVSDTLAKRLLHTRLTLNNVKYYVNIVNRNPTQLKFLRGWLNRALE